jgi:ADP-ribosylglycohydrolase
MLYGAIIGDIAGSIYEFNNIKYKPDEIMTDDCFFTDDTVMTIAIAHSLVSGTIYGFGPGMKAWGNRYPDAGYGAHFLGWLEGLIEGPYNSYGNGSAMRVSPVPYTCDNLEQVQEVAELTAIPTHNHPEGIKGAQVVASLIFLAKNGVSKPGLAEYATRMGYDIQPCDIIRPDYEFNETCQDTVPQAISAFIESTGFEDCIKLAISLGGDSDTLAAIAGSIAEAYYGVPEHLKNRCREFLPEQMLNVIDLFEDVYSKEA